eukprot:4345169-Ditylum_brightwellii.AAC.1
MTQHGHVGHAIDVVSSDCDGWDWEVYQDILHSYSVFTQLQIELHEALYQVNNLSPTVKPHG